MKKLNFKIIAISCLSLVIAGSIGLSGAYALPAGGNGILNPGIISDISSVVGSVLQTETETTASTQIHPGAENDLNILLGNLGLSSDILKLTDLIAYLNAGGTFESWIYDNYGTEFDIPESVKELSPQELVLYILGSTLDRDETTTKSGYVFTPSESETRSETKTKPETVTSKEPEIIPSTAYTSSEHITTDGAAHTTDAQYITGDANGDGRVTASDARLVLRASSHLTELDPVAFAAADVNGDKMITAKDARSILRYSAKITGTF